MEPHVARDDEVVDECNLAQTHGDGNHADPDEHQEQAVHLALVRDELSDDQVDAVSGRYPHEAPDRQESIHGEHHGERHEDEINREVPGDEGFERPNSAGGYVEHRGAHEAAVDNAVEVEQLGPPDGNRQWAQGLFHENGEDQEGRQQRQRPQHDQAEQDHGHRESQAHRDVLHDHIPDDNGAEQADADHQPGRPGPLHGTDPYGSCVVHP